MGGTPLLRSTKQTNSRYRCWFAGQSEMVARIEQYLVPLGDSRWSAPIGRLLRHRALVPGVGFEPTSPRFRRGAFTRLASQARLTVKMARTAGVEPTPLGGAQGLCR